MRLSLSQFSEYFLMWEDIGRQQLEEEADHGCRAEASLGLCCEGEGRRYGRDMR